MSLLNTLSLGNWWSLVKKAVGAWLDDYAPSMGAALSYYTVFSLAPMLLIVIAVAGLVFGREAAQGALFEQLNGLMGAEGAKAVEGILASASQPSEGILASAIGVVVLLVGATTVFGELQDALDRIWRSPARKPGGGLWGLLRARILSFGMILGIAFLLMVSLVVGAAVSALGKWWSPLFGGWEVLAQVVTFLFGLAVATVAFALIYKLMPRAKVEWRDVWIGAFVTAVLFSIGRFLIGLYIGKSDVASGFGAAGSLVIVFIWVYYSAQIFLLGAEFTWAFANAYGSRRHSMQTLGAEIDAASDKAETPARENVATAPTDRSPQRPSVRSMVAGGVAAGIGMRFLLPWMVRRLLRH